MSTSTEARRLEVVGTALDDRGPGPHPVPAREARWSRTRTCSPAGDAADRATSASRTPSSWPRAATTSGSWPSTRGALTQAQTFLVTRTLLLYEQPWFLPSAAASSLALLGLGFAVQRTRRRRARAQPLQPLHRGRARARGRHVLRARSKLLARIMNVLHHNSLMITGERRIGKTTLLHHLRKALEHDDGHRLPVLPRLHRPAGRARVRLLPRRHDRRGGPAPPAAGDAGGAALPPRPRVATTGATSATTSSAWSRTWPRARRRRSSSPSSSTRWTCSTSTRSASTSACAASS